MSNRASQVADETPMKTRAKAKEIRAKEHPSRLLFEAASKGELQRSRELLVKYANANYQERHRGTLRTPIHQAAELGYLDICKVLCEEAQANINLKDKDGNTPFHLAAAKGHFEIVKYFQQRYDPDPNTRNTRSYTSFHLAAFGGHLDVIKFLDEEAGVDPHAEDQYWNTAIHHAASEGHLHVLKYLCEIAKLNPQSVNRWKRTPLHRACNHGQTEIVKYLVEKCKVDANVRSLDGSTPLHLAVSNGHLETTRYLIKIANADCDVKDEKGETPVHCAAFSGRTELLKFLFSQGHVDVNAMNQNGDTPAIIAAIWNQQEALKFLLEEAHANPCLRNKSGFTAMHMAAREWNQEVCEYICKIAPECARVRDSKGLTPLMFVLNKWGQSKVNRLFLHKEGYAPFHVACEKGFEDMVRYLLICAKDYGELIHVPGANGDTPLIAVVARNHHRLIDLLLQKGADVNFRSKNGNTPLLTAIREKNMGLVKLLLANEAKINYPTDGDHTPLTLACALGDMDFVNLLLKRGAKLELPNKNGETPLIVACQMRNIHLIKELLAIGSQVNFPQNGKFTPLIAACLFGEVDMVQMLLEKGAIIDMPNMHKGMPLHAAAKRGKKDIVRILLNKLLDKNLSIDVSGISGHTPVMKASMNGHAGIVKMLVDSGAALYLPDKAGNTPVIEAARRHHADVLRLLVASGADVDQEGDNGQNARSFVRGDPSLSEALDTGLAEFSRKVRGPVLKIRSSGFLNASESINDGFSYSSQVLPILCPPSSFSWGSMQDPRRLHAGTLGGILVTFDSRRDLKLQHLLKRAAHISNSFSDQRSRVQGIGMFVANDCGGTAIQKKRELARDNQIQLRDRLKLDALSIGELVPGFGLDRMRCLLFKYIVSQFSDTTSAASRQQRFKWDNLSCRIVSRPSSGSGFDERKPWPKSFSWIEVAFDPEGPFFVLDMMKDPGLLLYENSQEATAYRSGAVFHDERKTMFAIFNLDVKQHVQRFTTSNRVQPKKSRRNRKGRKSIHNLFDASMAARQDPDGNDVLDESSEVGSESNSVIDEGSQNGSDTWSDSPGQRPNMTAMSEGDEKELGTAYEQILPDAIMEEEEDEKQDVDAGKNQEGTYIKNLKDFKDLTELNELKDLNDRKKATKSGKSSNAGSPTGSRRSRRRMRRRKKQQKTDVEEVIEVVNEEEEDLQAVDGKVEWLGRWDKREVRVTRYPVLVSFGDSEIQRAKTWFYDDSDVLSSMKHRCIDRIIAIDRVNRSIVREKYERRRLYEFVKSCSGSLDDEIRLSILLQIAETMEYLHTMETPVVNSSLRVHDIYVQVLDESDVNADSANVPLTVDNVMIRLPEAGLPRRVEKIVQRHPLKGAAVYYPPERLCLSDPEGPEAEDTREADVFAFVRFCMHHSIAGGAEASVLQGVVAIFVGSGELPWAHFQVEEVIDKFEKQGLRPGFPPNTPEPIWYHIVTKCFERDPRDRPSFTQIIRMLQQTQNLE